MAWFVRDARLLRRFLPSAVVVAIGLVLAAAIAATRGSAAFGPYGGALGRGYHLSQALHWIVYQAGDVLLLVMGIPLVAAIALTVACLRRRESAEVSALVAVSGALLRSARPRGRHLRLALRGPDQRAHDGHARSAVLRRARRVARPRDAAGESNGDRRRGCCAGRVLLAGREARRQRDRARLVHAGAAVRPQPAHLRDHRPARLDRRCGRRARPSPRAPTPVCGGAARAGDRRPAALERPGGNEDRPPRIRRPPDVLRRRPPRSGSSAPPTARSSTSTTTRSGPAPGTSPTGTRKSRS